MQETHDSSGQGAGRKVKQYQPLPVRQTAPTLSTSPPMGLTMVCVHVDNAGPIHRKMFLILTDAHSKWIDVGSATSAATTNKLRTMFTICIGCQGILFLIVE